MKKLCAIIAVGCAIWILGLAGAADLNTMSLGAITTQLCIALPLFYLSIKIGGNL